MQAVVESCYGPEAGSFYAESGIPESEWDGAWENHGYASDFHWAPCVADLPRYRPTPTPADPAAHDLHALAVQFTVTLTSPELRSLAAFLHSEHLGANDVAVVRQASDDHAVVHYLGGSGAPADQDGYNDAYDLTTSSFLPRPAPEPTVSLPSPPAEQGWVALGFALGIMAESSRYGTDAQRAELAEGFVAFTAQDGRMVTSAGWIAYESRILDYVRPWAD